MIASMMLIMFFILTSMIIIRIMIGIIIAIINSVIASVAVISLFAGTMIFHLLFAGAKNSVIVVCSSSMTVTVNASRRPPRLTMLQVQGPITRLMWPGPGWGGGREHTGDEGREISWGSIVMAWPRICW